MSTHTNNPKEDVKMRNGNGKKMVAVLLSMAMLVTLFFNGVPANAMSENGEVYSQETYVFQRLAYIQGFFL